MSIDEVDTFLEKEDGVLLLRKKSEASFLEEFLGNSTSLVGLIYLLSKQKLDSLIITRKRLLYTIKNKVVKEYVFKNLNSIEYNTNSSVLIIIDNSEKVVVSLTKLRITYEESKNIKGLLNKFNNGFIPRFSN